MDQTGCDTHEITKQENVIQTIQKRLPMVRKRSSSPEQIPVAEKYADLVLPESERNRKRDTKAADKTETKLS